jgi:adenylate cyclase
VLRAAGNTAEAVVEAQRAIDLNPSDIGGYATLCFVLGADGQLKKEIECSEKAIRLSPRDPFLFAFFNGNGRAYLGLQQYDRAIEWLRRAVAENPDFPTSLSQLSAVLALDGHDAEARERLRQYLTHPRTSAKTIGQVRAGSHGPLDAASFELFLKGLRKAGMPEE